MSKPCPVDNCGGIVTERAPIMGSIMPRYRCDKNNMHEWDVTGRPVWEIVDALTAHPSKETNE